MVEEGRNGSAREALARLIRIVTDSKVSRQFLRSTHSESCLRSAIAVDEAMYRRVVAAEAGFLSPLKTN